MSEKLTKEKCLEALTNCDSLYEVLYDLINYRFDNPPLKFEELESNMWVWDNKKKRYSKIDDFLLGRMIYFYNDYICNFEEGRFYRKQVEE